MPHPFCFALRLRNWCPSGAAAWLWARVLRLQLASDVSEVGPLKYLNSVAAPRQVKRTLDREDEVDNLLAGKFGLFHRSGEISVCGHQRSDVEHIPFSPQSEIQGHHDVDQLLLGSCTTITQITEFYGHPVLSAYVFVVPELLPVMGFGSVLQERSCIVVMDGDEIEPVANRFSKSANIVLRRPS